MDGTIVLQGFRFRESHLGQFRIGEGHMRNDVAAVADRQAEQGVPDDEPRVIIGNMGELQTARHIANGIDMFLRCSQALVDGDALGCIDNAGRFQVQSLDIGRTPRGDKQMTAGDLSMPGCFDSDAGFCFRYFFDGRVSENLYAVTAQALQNNGRQFRIVLGQRRESFDDRNVRTQAPVRLRQFHADGARRQ